MYDDKVRDFVKDIGIENIGKRLVNSREGKVTLPAMSDLGSVHRNVRVKSLPVLFGGALQLPAMHATLAIVDRVLGMLQVIIVISAL